jgi:hypothetical protein
MLLLQIQDEAISCIVAAITIQMYSIICACLNIQYDCKEEYIKV